MIHAATLGDAPSLSRLHTAYFICVLIRSALPSSFSLKLHLCQIYKAVCSPDSVLLIAVLTVTHALVMLRAKTLDPNAGDGRQQDQRQDWTEIQNGLMRGWGAGGERRSNTGEQNEVEVKTANEADADEVWRERPTQEERRSTENKSNERDDSAGFVSTPTSPSSFISDPHHLFVCTLVWHVRYTSSPCTFFPINTSLCVGKGVRVVSVCVHHLNMWLQLWQDVTEHF